MYSLLIFIIVCISITNIIVNESIFERPKAWIDKVFPYSILNGLLKCCTCCGFWVGIFVSLLFNNFEMHWFIGGCISSIVNKLYYIIENKLI